MSSRSQSNDSINELSNKRLKTSQSITPQKTIPIDSTPLLKRRRRQTTLPMYLIVYEELPDGSTVERSVIDPRFPKYRTDDVYITNNLTKIPENIKKISNISSTNFTTASKNTSFSKTIDDKTISSINTINNKESYQEIQKEFNEFEPRNSIDHELLSDLEDESERNENFSTQKNRNGILNETHIPEIITISDDEEIPCHNNRVTHSFYTDINVLSPTSSLDIELGSEVSDLEEVDLGKSMWETQKHKDSQPNDLETLNIVYVSETFCLPVVKDIIEIGSSTEDSDSSLIEFSDDEVTSSDDDYYTGFRIYDLISDVNSDTMLQIMKNSLPYEPKKSKQKKPIAKKLIAKRSIANSVRTVKRRKTRS